MHNRKTLQQINVQIGPNVGIQLRHKINVRQDSEIRLYSMYREDNESGKPIKKNIPYLFLR